MKKLLAALLVSTMLMSSMANAGILILTGDIGNKFTGYKVVGWLTVALTGGTLVGLVVDENQQVDNYVQLPELSEVSLSLIGEATREIREAAGTQSSIITTVSEDVANQVLALEGLEGSEEGSLLFKTLTTAN